MKRSIFFRVALFFLLFTVSYGAELQHGASMSSDSFRVIDSSQSVFGNVSSASSSSFRLWSSLADVFIGSSSATTYRINSGFLTHPFVIAPTIASAIAGTEQVLVLWTQAQAQLGLTVASYNICQKFGSSGYSCTGVGSSTSSTRSGLSGGTVYTFKVQALDTYGSIIAESTEVSATPAAPSQTTGGGGSGGGSGGGVIVGTTSSLELVGIAYPSATVHVMRDGTEIGTVQADAQGRFLFARTNLTSGDAIIGLWATDNAKRRSITWTFAISLPASAQARGAGIIIPPTISLQSDVVNPAASLLIQGSSTPGASITISFLPNKLEFTTTVGLDGIWRFSKPGADLGLGEYYVKARTTLLPAQDKSEWSQLLPFTIGFAKKGSQCENGPDVNGDGKIDLVDFSILAYWWDQSVSTGAAYDLNCDDRVTLADFSILAFGWTGR